MKRSYSELQLCGRHRRGRSAPLRPGQAAHVQGRLLSRRGGSGGHVEMAASLILTRLPKMISNWLGGNARSPERPPFPHFQGYFRGHENQHDGGHHERPGTLKRGICRGLSSDRASPAAWHRSPHPSYRTGSAIGFILGKWRAASSSSRTHVL